MVIGTPAKTKKAAQPARDRIVTAAYELFAENGFEGTTTKQIAQLAKVNEVTIFRAFGSKETLFQEVLKDKLPLKGIRTVVDFEMDGPLESVMAQNAKNVLSVLKQDRYFFMMLLGEVWRHPEFKERIGAVIYHEAIVFLADQLQALMDRGKLRNMDPTIAARAWIGMVQSYYIFNYLVGPGAVDPTEEENDLKGLAEIFVRGIENKEGI